MVECEEPFMGGVGERLQGRTVERASKRSKERGSNLGLWARSTILVSRYAYSAPGLVPVPPCYYVSIYPV